jgi:hypothetical protein
MMYRHDKSIDLEQFQMVSILVQAYNSFNNGYLTSAD